MVIDSHHHFWRYDAEQYPWIGQGMEVLKRDFLPGDLQAEAGRAGVDGVVSVQARQTLEETRWLCRLAEQHQLVRGVVGWVPLAAPEIDDVLGVVTRSPWLKGVRHVVQDEPDDAFLLREEFNRGVARLKHYHLVYDILIYARHLPNTIRFVDRHPEQPFVLDHIAKPTIRAARFDDDWAAHLRELARREHVVCKVSGIVTEVRDPEWSIELIRPYWEVVLEAFGPGRLLFGTDWPVCLLRTDYATWTQIVRQLIASLSPAEQAQIMGENARRVYRLDAA